MRVSTDWTWTHGEGEAVVSVHWPGFRVLVREFLPRDAELGDDLMDMPGSGGRGESAHTDTTVRGVPRCRTVL